MPALDRVDIKGEHARTIAYDWSWTVAIFALHGRNRMTVSPPPSVPGAPFRVDVVSTGGDLGEGRLVWRVFPDGPDAAVVELAMRIDMRDANYIARALASGGTSVNRTINVALAHVMLLATQTEAERQSGYRAPSLPLGPLERPHVDLDALRELVRRGDLVMLDTRGEYLQSAVVIGRGGATAPMVRRVLADPEEFGRSFVHGSRAHVIGRDARGVTFSWSIPLPLVGVGGVMRLQTQGTEVRVDGVSGSFKDGRWRFDTVQLPWSEVAVIGWARFDPTDSTALVKRMVGSNGYFRQGLVAGVEMMTIRSLRARVWELRRTERERAAAAVKSSARDTASAQ